MTMFLCKLDNDECSEDPCMFFAGEPSDCPKRYTEAPKNQPPFGLLERLVRWPVLWGGMNILLWGVLFSKLRVDFVDDLICTGMILVWVVVTIRRIRAT